MYMSSIVGPRFKGLNDSDMHLLSKKTNTLAVFINNNISEGNTFDKVFAPITKICHLIHIIKDTNSLSLTLVELNKQKKYMRKILHNFTIMHINLSLALPASDKKRTVMMMLDECLNATCNTLKLLY